MKFFLRNGFNKKYRYLCKKYKFLSNKVHFPNNL